MEYFYNKQKGIIAKIEGEFFFFEPMGGVTQMAFAIKTKEPEKNKKVKKPRGGG